MGKFSVYLNRHVFVTIFLFLHENICCGYLLEAPQWDTSNECPQHIFLWRNQTKYLSGYTRNLDWILLPCSCRTFVSCQILQLLRQKKWYHIYPLYSDTFILIKIVLKFVKKKTFFYLLMCLKIVGWGAISADHDQMPHSVASDLGLHCVSSGLSTYILMVYMVILSCKCFLCHLFVYFFPLVVANTERSQMLQ